MLISKSPLTLIHPFLTFYFHSFCSLEFASKFSTHTLTLTLPVKLFFSHPKVTYLLKKASLIACSLVYTSEPFTPMLSEPLSKAELPSLLSRPVFF